MNRDVKIFNMNKLNLKFMLKLIMIYLRQIILVLYLIIN